MTAQIRPAMLLLDVNTGKAQRRPLTQGVDRKDRSVIPIARMWRHFRVGETARHVLKGDLIVRKVEIHREAYP